ncbi:MAG: hypothetical protein ACXVFN_14860 [Solirubrobacteraceae bacterium]
MIVLSRDTRKVARLSTSVEAKCTSGRRFSFMASGAAGLPIGTSGSFTARQTHSADFGGGVTATRTTDIRGKVSGHRVSGTVKGHATVRDAAGAVTDTCSMSATYKAVASKGEVFAGTTSQDGPVVIELAAGKPPVVHHFHIAWQATCTPEGGFQVGDTLLNIPIAASRFATVFTQDYPESSGGKETDAYALRGRVGSTTASGTLRVAITETDPSGAPGTRCDTRSVSFRASSG